MLHTEVDIVKTLIHNRDFHDRAIRHLLPDYFIENAERVELPDGSEREGNRTALRLILKVLKQYHHRYQDQASTDVVRQELLTIKGLSDDTVINAEELLDYIDLPYDQEHNTDYLVDTVELWAKKRALYIAVMSAAEDVEDPVKAVANVPKLLESALAVSFKGDELFNSATLFNDEPLDLEPTPYLIKSIVERGKSTVNYGLSGHGKTFVLIDQMLHVALGWDWCGHKVNQAGVLYFAQEGVDAVRKRLNAFRKTYGDKTTNARFARFNIPLDMYGEVDYLKIIEIINKTPEKFGWQTGWVVVDTLAQVRGSANENTGDMQRVMNHATTIVNTTGVHFTFVHHTGWTNQERMKGSVDIRGAVDGTNRIWMEDGENVIRFATDKSRDGMKIKKFFEIVPVVIGQDRDGDEIASAVLREVEEPTQGKTYEILDIVKELCPALNDFTTKSAIRKLFNERFPTAGKNVFGDEWKALTKRTKHVIYLPNKAVGTPHEDGKVQLTFKEGLINE